MYWYLFLHVCQELIDWLLILLQGYVFVDRDGKHFRHILNWLRDGVVPTLEDNEYLELLREAEYYQLLVSHSIFHVQSICCLASFLEQFGLWVWHLTNWMQLENMLLLQIIDTVQEWRLPVCSFGYRWSLFILGKMKQLKCALGGWQP